LKYQFSQVSLLASMEIIRTEEQKKDIVTEEHILDNKDRRTK